METFDKNFGLLIAFGLPGFILLAGLPPTLSSPLVNLCVSETQPTLGGFLYLLPASIGCGLVLSAIRWALVDTFLHYTGLTKPQINFADLNQQLPAFAMFVEHNYRYYQFYSNSLVAILVLLVARARFQMLPTLEVRLWIAALLVVLLAASRDCLKRFYQRASQALPNSRTTGQVRSTKGKRH